VLPDKVDIVRSIADEMGVPYEEDVENRGGIRFYFDIANSDLHAFISRIPEAAFARKAIITSGENPFQ